MAGNSVLYYALVALFGAVLILSALNAHFFASRNLCLLKRWTRCFFFSLAIALILDSLLPERRFEALLVGGFLLFFLGESLFYWIQLSVFNAAGLPLFAKYEPAENAWLSAKKYVLLKRSIEKLGFKKCAAYKSEIEGIETFATCFENAEKTVGLSVAFVPYTRKMYLTEFGYYSVLADGSRICTDSSSLPFGLEYPPNWRVERHPCVSSPSKLLKIHMSRLKAREEAAVRLPDTPNINAELGEVEMTCRKCGLTNPPTSSGGGILTPKGKYRLWKDMILVNFLPFFAR